MFVSKFTMRPSTVKAISQLPKATFIMADSYKLRMKENAIEKNYFDKTEINLVKSIIAKLDADAKKERSKLSEEIDESLHFIPTSEKRKRREALAIDGYLSEILHNQGIPEDFRLYKSLAEWKNL